MSSDLFDDDEEEVFGGLGEDGNILAGDFDKYRDCSDQDDDDLELDDPSPEPDDDDDDDLDRDNPSPEPDDDDDEGLRRRDAIMKEIRSTVSKVEWVNEMPNGWNSSAPQDERECLRAEGLESPATTNRLSVIQPGGQKKFQKNFVPKPTGKAVACSVFKLPNYEAILQGREERQRKLKAEIAMLARQELQRRTSEKHAELLDALDRMRKKKAKAVRELHQHLQQVVLDKHRLYWKKYYAIHRLIGPRLPVVTFNNSITNVFGKINEYPDDYWITKEEVQYNHDANFDEVKFVTGARYMTALEAARIGRAYLYNKFYNLSPNNRFASLEPPVQNPGDILGTADLKIFGRCTYEVHLYSSVNAWSASNHADNQRERHRQRLADNKKNERESASKVFDMKEATDKHTLEIVEKEAADKEESKQSQTLMVESITCAVKETTTLLLDAVTTAISSATATQIENTEKAIDSILKRNQLMQTTQTTNEDTTVSVTVAEPAPPVAEPAPAPPVAEPAPAPPVAEPAPAPTLDEPAPAPTLLDEPAPAPTVDEPARPNKRIRISLPLHRGTNALPPPDLLTTPAGYPLFKPSKMNRSDYYVHCRLVAPKKRPRNGTKNWKSIDAKTFYCILCKSENPFSPGNSNQIARHIASDEHQSNLKRL